MLCLLVLLAAPEARATAVHVDACQCLLKPGDRARVRVRFENSGTKATELVVGHTLPNGKRSLFLRPIGFLVTPGSWMSVPAGTPETAAFILDVVLTSESLPTGEYPLVPPFHHRFFAVLIDPTTRAPVTPVASSFFEFAPHGPLPAPTQPGSLYLVPHQHADIAWLNRETVNLPAEADYIRASILEARRRSDYRFVIDQPFILKAFAERYPELVDELRGLFQRGIAEPAGGYFTQPDLNLLSGESIVRQAIYGQQYLEREWGGRARIGWNLDSFGHSPQMPQITKKAGMDYYAFTRGIPDLTALGVSGSEFYWESPDGSRVLASYLPFGYQLGRGIGNGLDDDQEITTVFEKVQPTASGESLLALAGADVSEHVFNPGVPEAVAAWNQHQVAGVSARLATPSEFFQAVAAAGANLSVVANVEFQDDGEANDPRIFPGAYATRVGIKQNNNRAEHKLLSVEAIATMASLEGALFPEASLRQQGELLARNQSHDYLPGTGVDEIYKDLRDRFAAVDQALDARLDEATQYLAGRIDTAGDDGTVVQTVVVFNTMAWTRRDLIRVPFDRLQPLFPAKLVDADGAEVPYQLITQDGRTSELAFVATTPPMGYTTFRFKSGSPSQPADEVVSPSPGPQQIGLGAFTAQLDDQAFLRRLVSNATGEDVISLPGIPSSQNLGGLLWWSNEVYGNAYDYDPRSITGSLAAVPQTVVRAVGPVATRLIARSKLADRSSARREMTFVPDLGRIDFATTVDWMDVNKNLFVRFPLSSRAGAKITEGVPYGFMERGAGRYPALGWADFGTENIGVSILNRGLFGHSFSLEPGSTSRQATTPQTLDIALLRSMDRAVFGEYPSEAMKEQGVHGYDYSIRPREASWRVAGTPRHASEFNSPLIVSVVPPHRGTLPAQRSYLSLDEGSGAIVTVFRRDGDDIVVRLYETKGQAATLTLDLRGIHATRVEETNLLGEPVQVLDRARSLSIQCAPQEITTLRLVSAR